MPSSSTKPRSVVYWNSTLRTNTRHIRGFQPYCACGWEGRIWASHRESQLERSFHRCQESGRD